MSQKVTSEGHQIFEARNSRYFYLYNASDPNLALPRSRAHTKLHQPVAFLKQKRKSGDVSMWLACPSLKKGGNPILSRIDHYSSKLTSWALMAHAERKLYRLISAKPDIAN